MNKNEQITIGDAVISRMFTGPFFDGYHCRRKSSDGFLDTYNFYPPIVPLASRHEPIRQILPQEEELKFLKDWLDGKLDND